MVGQRSRLVTQVQTRVIYFVELEPGNDAVDHRLVVATQELFADSSQTDNVLPTYSLAPFSGQGHTNDSPQTVDQDELGQGFLFLGVEEVKHQVASWPVVTLKLDQGIQTVAKFDVRRTRRRKTKKGTHGILGRT